MLQPPFSVRVYFSGSPIASSHDFCICAVLLRGHRGGSQGTVPTSAQMLTQMQVHSSASGVSILQLIFSLAPCFCIVFPPGATQSPSEKEVMQGAAWSPLEMLEFLREAVKRPVKQDYNWANNPRLQRWLGNPKGRLLLAEPTLNSGLDLSTWVTHINPHRKALIWHPALAFQSPLSSFS